MVLVPLGLVLIQLLSVYSAWTSGFLFLGQMRSVELKVPGRTPIKFS